MTRSPHLCRLLERDSIKIDEPEVGVALPSQPFNSNYQELDSFIMGILHSFSSSSFFSFSFSISSTPSAKANFQQFNPYIQELDQPAFILIFYLNSPELRNHDQQLNKRNLGANYNIDTNTLNWIFACFCSVLSIWWWPIQFSSSNGPQLVATLPPFCPTELQVTPSSSKDGWWSLSSPNRSQA